MNGLANVDGGVVKETGSTTETISHVQLEPLAPQLDNVLHSALFTPAKYSTNTRSTKHGTSWGCACAYTPVRGIDRFSGAAGRLPRAEISPPLHPQLTSWGRCREIRRKADDSYPRGYG